MNISQDLIDRSFRLEALIQNYLNNGGLFNPEYMEHDKVRDLILDVREYLYSLQEGSQREAQAAGGVDKYTPASK